MQQQSKVYRCDSKTGLENGSFSYVIMNQIKVIAVGPRELKPVTEILSGFKPNVKASELLKP